MADVADYDAGEITDREQSAADNLGAISSWNAQSTLDQLDRTLANYDQADRQNRALADAQLYQNSWKARNERFAQNKKLQAAAQQVSQAMGNAMRGSTLYGLNDMLRTRQDLDNNDVWTTLYQNQHAVENAYQESLNQNALARNEALSDAEYSLRGLKSDLAAQLNNINPNLYQTPENAGSDINWQQYGSRKNEGAPWGQGQSNAAYHAQAGHTSAHNWVNTMQNGGYRPNRGNTYIGSLLDQYNQTIRS